MGGGSQALTKSTPPPPPELPFDVVDASGLFAAFGGLLTLALPYFIGLTAALSAVLLGLGLLRGAQGPFAPGHAGPARTSFLLGLGLLSLGWIVFLLPGLALAGTQPLLLGGLGLPLWWVARRAVPFGGG